MLVLNLGKSERKTPIGRAVSTWREHKVYLMDHSILPTIEGLAVGAREGSV
jgi:hypothetical protein